MPPHFRVTSEPCPEPATHEVLDPCHYLLCEEHARAAAEEPNDADWLETEDPERYARECEEAASSLFRWMRSDETNPVTYYILEEALTYLEVHELPRARAPRGRRRAATDRVRIGEPALLRGARPKVRLDGRAPLGDARAEMASRPDERRNMTEQTVRIRPTVLVLDREGDETLGLATAWEGEEKALIVFRGPEDAFRFQERDGRYTPEEGYHVIGMNHQALGALLAKEGIGYVAMPEPWTGEGVVDTFKAGDFIALLEESLQSRQAHLWSAEPGAYHGSRPFQH